MELSASDVVPAELLLAELATADIPRVRMILKQEQSTANRDVIVNTAQAVLDKVKAATPQPPPKHELISG